MEEDIKISVIMGIYNCADTLADAIESILIQTIDNWELIMCDDGSRDNTYEIALAFAEQYPHKIFLLKNKENKGLNYTLNRCLNLAKGNYIARMDGDDLCSTDRFEKELQAFKAHPDLAVVSTAMEYFDENGVWGCIRHPQFVTKKIFIWNSILSCSMYGKERCDGSCRRLYRIKMVIKSRGLSLVDKNI